MWNTTFKNLNGYCLLKQTTPFKFFKGCLPQTLIGLTLEYFVLDVREDPPEMFGKVLNAAILSNTRIVFFPCLFLSVGLICALFFDSLNLWWCVTKYFQKFLKNLCFYSIFSRRTNLFYFSNFEKLEMKTTWQIHVKDDNRLGIAREIWIEKRVTDVFAI